MGAAHLQRLEPGAAPRESLVRSLATAGVRNLAGAEVAIGTGLTVVFGPNGAGKTNLLEALYFALAGRSCRTSDDRELIAFGGRLARAEALVAIGGAERRFAAAISRDEGRRHLLDGKRLRGSGAAERPPVGVFMPDRLSLVKGPPAQRRAHLDRLVAALWPARAGERRRYDGALAQRNALLGRVRARAAAAAALDAWDREMAAAAAELIEGRAMAVGLLAEPFRAAAVELGLPGEAGIRYRPRCDAVDANGVAAELRAARERDVVRGRSTHGPHRDELELTLAGRAARRYASQGEQRAALLALLFAERDVLLAERGVSPLMLLDDVMSELDPERRELLVERLGRGGQALITATHDAQVPACERHELHLAAGSAIAPAGVSVAAA